MRLWAGVLAAAALWQAGGRVSADPHYFLYQRLLTTKGETNPYTGPSCAVLPGDLYAQSPTLADVRLYSGFQEVPYVLSTSQTTPTGDAAKVLDAGLRNGHITFDLEMPARAYTDVKLDLGGANFVATATVNGLKSVTEEGGTALGSFTLFDLSGTGLGRSTTLKLVESTFPYLHVDLAVAGAGGKPFTSDAALILGAEVPPSREAQTLYTTVAQTSAITQDGRHSAASFHLPAHVPVERVTFTLAPGDHTNFSRAVSVNARIKTADPQDPDARESITGTIGRIQMTQNSRELREESLSVPATLGANMNQSAVVQVWIENGDDKPLPISAVALEMRQRLLCFDGQAAERPTLRYGDPRLQPPVYDYSRTFDPVAAKVAYDVGPEQANSLYTPQPTADTRSFTDKHPALIWLALLAVVGALGLVAFRSAKKV